MAMVVMCVRACACRADIGDSTSARGRAPLDLASACIAPEAMTSTPLKGKRFGLVRETMGEGVSEGVQDAIRCAWCCDCW